MSQKHADVKPGATSLLLYEPYANESSQICPFPAARTQFDSDHHQHRRLSSHSYSHESVIFCIFWINILLSYGEFAFFSVEMHAATLRLQPLKTSTAGAGQSIILQYLGDRRLRTVAEATKGCGTRSPLYLIGDAASRRGLSRVGYFIPLNGPLNGQPPSI